MISRSGSTSSMTAISSTGLWRGLSDDDSSRYTPSCLCKKMRDEMTTSSTTKAQACVVTTLSSDTRRNRTVEACRRRRRIQRNQIIPRGGVGDVRHRHHLPTLIGIINVVVVQRPRRGNEKTVVITAAVIAGNDVLDHDQYLRIIAVIAIAVVN